MWRDKENHPSETSLDNYAMDKKFDLYLESEFMGKAQMVNLVMAQLDKNVWLEKR